MFLQKVVIQNYKKFNNCTINLKTPDGSDRSGLNIIVGQNGCGKTTILESISLLTSNPFYSNISPSDFFENKLNNEIVITGYTNENFNVKRVYGFNNNFTAKGFEFKAYLRKKAGSKIFNPVIVKDNLYLSDEKIKKNKNDDTGKIYDTELKQTIQDSYGSARHGGINIQYLNKNRNLQIKNGDYNNIISRIAEELNYNFLKKENKKFIEPLRDISNELKDGTLKKIDSVSKSLEQFANRKFDLGIFNEQNLFESLRVVLKTDSGSVDISKSGTGIESIFVLLLMIELIKEEKGGDLVICIDEPELNLHPQLEKAFFNKLCELSKNIQIIYVTHSENFVNPECHKNIIKINLNNEFENKNIGDLGIFIEDRSRFYRRHRKLFFQEKVIFVEGKDDIERYSKFCNKNGFTNLEDYFVEMNGCDDVEFWIKFCNEFDILAYFIVDEDYAYKRPYGSRKRQQETLKQSLKKFKDNFNDKITIEDSKLEEWFKDLEKIENKSLKNDIKFDTTESKFNYIEDKKIIVLKEGEVKDYLDDEGETIDQPKLSELNAIFSFLNIKLTQNETIMEEILSEKDEDIGYVSIKKQTYEVASAEETLNDVQDTLNF